MGEHFPVNYLALDVEFPTEADLRNYMDKMMRIIDNFLENANNTDVNQAMGSFLSKAVLKRTLRDYSKGLPKYKNTIKSIASKCDYVVSHYTYVLERSAEERPDAEINIGKVIKDDTAHVFSISDFNRHKMRHWILRPGAINKFIAKMDTLELPKENYVDLVEDSDKYDITAFDSDRCLSRVHENIDPYDITSLRRCNLDEYCMEKIFLSPSVAYTISHRLLNNMMYLHNRRCYLYSMEYDNMHMDMLCSEMYRETVYLARRGYFYRDLFMEHVGLCGMLGYEEFHRPRWFRKAASWVDDEGCIAEFPNFEVNRTRRMLKDTTDPKEAKKIRKYLSEVLIEECHPHQMSVALMVLANGIRHAAHYIVNMSEKEL
ncbi:uncharacterized protein LOC126369138 [Pectinophora gossypiella]|uniref:uncharacterized protein LOC126369138 n=1 Tax=Pectinophora gossypiella TaxID=13191 RepID=UPI00214F4F45|nr:uncharacterized protein LOC126369138 [Pectinophora gossypiella]